MSNTVYQFLLKLNQAPHYQLNNYFFNNGKNKPEYELFQKVLESEENFSVFWEKSSLNPLEKDLHFKLRDIFYDKYFIDEVLFPETKDLEADLFEIEEFQTLEMDFELLQLDTPKNLAPVSKIKDKKVISFQINFFSFWNFSQNLKLSNKQKQDLLKKF